MQEAGSASYRGAAAYGDGGGVQVQDGDGAAAQETRPAAGRVGEPGRYVVEVQRGTGQS